MNINIYIYIHVNACKHFQNVLYMCVFIHNTYTHLYFLIYIFSLYYSLYTVHTHILCKQILLFWMRLIVINHLTALVCVCVCVCMCIYIYIHIYIYIYI